ncbi:MAG: hypothetical protein RLZZ76_463 [Candidatus Parcubacteria bacterium]|jgi:hypothetical protein
MNEKRKEPGMPGYLHFLVLSRYILDAVTKGKVTWAELELSGEVALYKLELECFTYAQVHHKKQAESYEVWVKPALEAKLKSAEGKMLTAEERDNIIELFPDAEAA